MAACLWAGLQRNVFWTKVALSTVYKCRFLCGDRLEHLSKQQFWKSKYEEGTVDFDWFLSKENLSNFVKCILQQHHENYVLSGHLSGPSKNIRNVTNKFHILDVGCGTSAVPACFYDWKDYPVSVHCLDYIHEAVRFQMQNIKAATPGQKASEVHCIRADACRLPYRSDTFHLITDKGTMDSLLKDFTTGREKAWQMMLEVYRVLQSGGVFMQISDEDPDSRLFFLETLGGLNCKWTVKDLSVEYEMNNSCFVYCFQK